MYAQKPTNEKMNVSKRGEAGGVKRNEAIRGRPEQSTASSRGSSPSSERVQGASGSVLRASDASSCSAGELSESSSVKPSAAAAGYVDPDHTQNTYSQESKPKRPLTCYNMYFRCERKRILAKISEGLPPGTRPKIDFEELGRLISGRWKETTQDERKKYRAMAALDRKRYERQMEEWRTYMGSVIDEMVGDEDEAAEPEITDRKPAAVAQPIPDQNAAGLGGLMVDPSLAVQSQGAQRGAANAAQTAIGSGIAIPGIYVGQSAMNADLAAQAAIVTAALAAYPSLSAATFQLPPLPLSQSQNPTEEGLSRPGIVPLGRWINEHQGSTLTSFPLDWMSPSNRSVTTIGDTQQDFAFVRPQQPPIPQQQEQARPEGPPRVDRPDLIAELADRLGDDGVDLVIRACRTL